MTLASDATTKFRHQYSKYHIHTGSQDDDATSTMTIGMCESEMAQNISYNHVLKFTSNEYYFTTESIQTDDDMAVEDTYKTSVSQNGQLQPVVLSKDAN